MQREWFSEDITFCGHSCNRKTCPRNSKNIKLHSIPHSFAMFYDNPQYCPIAKARQTRKEKAYGKQNRGE